MQDDDLGHEARHRWDLDEPQPPEPEPRRPLWARLAGPTGWVIGVVAGCMIFAIVAIVVRASDPTGNRPSGMSTPKPSAIEFSPLPDEELPAALSAMPEVPLGATATTTAKASTAATNAPSPLVTGTGSASAKPGGPPPPATTYSAVAGYGCASDATKGFQMVGQYTEGQSGWLYFTSGAWAQDGCNGGYASMPMYGEADRYDANLYSQWFFAVGAASKSCTISTYVPSTSVPRNVSGKPAVYQVKNTEAGPAVSSFTVDQRIQRGVWVTAGTFAVTGGRLVVRSLDQGADWDAAGPTYEHIAVAQIRVVCQ